MLVLIATVLFTSSLSYAIRGVRIDTDEVMSLAANIESSLAAVRAQRNKASELTGTGGWVNSRTEWDYTLKTPKIPRLDNGLSLGTFRVGIFSDTNKVPSAASFYMNIRTPHESASLGEGFLKKLAIEAGIPEDKIAISRTIEAAETKHTLMLPIYKKGSSEGSYLDSEKVLDIFKKLEVKIQEIEEYGVQP